MGGDRIERVAELMARMAAGDIAAMATLLQEFAGPIRATVARLYRSFNVMPDADDLDGGVVETGLVLFDHARGWSPDGGAMPWRWAEPRMRNMVSREIGQHTSDLEGVRHPEARPLATEQVDDADLDAVLAAAAIADDRWALVLGALKECLSARDAAVLLAFDDRKAGGDPSPADTVAQMFGLSTVNVRKVASRSRRKLVDLVCTDQRFASLRADHAFGS